MHRHQGFLGQLTARLYRNRLGELLVQKGQITPEQLHHALKAQKQTHQTLGRVMEDLGYVTRLQVKRGLMEQHCYRFMLAVVTLFIGLASYAPHSTKASPFQQKLNYNHSMTHKATFHPRDTLNTNKKTDRPLLFGSQEVQSTDITAFTKWTETLIKLENVTFKPEQTSQFSAMTVHEKVEAVNAYVNSFRYIEDKVNYGQSDYWATPAEFFARGGDCEDFAITKYALLKAVGIPAGKMRLAIVQDKIKNIPHALLIVYTDEGPMVLDNQVQGADFASDVKRYKPIYSINANGWWRHLG